MLEEECLFWWWCWCLGELVNSVTGVLQEMVKEALICVPGI